MKFHSKTLETELLWGLTNVYHLKLGPTWPSKMISVTETDAHSFGRHANHDKSTLLSGITNQHAQRFTKFEWKPPILPFWLTLNRTHWVGGAVLIPSMRHHKRRKATNSRNPPFSMTRSFFSRNIDPDPCRVHGQCTTLAESEIVQRNIHLATFHPNRNFCSLKKKMNFFIKK